MDEVERVARERLGLRELRAGQAEAVRAVVAGRDTLAVMPTGWGKTAVYELAAVLLDGPTVVVSPLIALQRDQVDAVGGDVGGATQVNSTRSASAQREALAGLREGHVELLLLAPEQLRKPDTLAQLQEATPSLFVVDEAHCISEWGHDFRPDYLHLGAVVDALGRPPLLALTATAAPPVRSEIVERLRMRDPFVLVCGFDRPNIHLAVRRFGDERRKTEAVVNAAAATPGSGIVYVATRRRAEEVAAALRGAGVEARHYHGGMASGERDDAQQAFMDERARVIVATTAFGMGVDKASVRFVFHYDIPESVDAYYQEIGRAGRDGEPSEACLLYRAEDLGVRRFFAGGKAVDAETAQQIVEAVHARGGPTPIGDLEDETGLSASKLTSATSRLERTGAVELLPAGEVTAGDGDVSAGAAGTAAADADEAHRRMEESRIAMMRGYAETTDCRRAYLLNYLGEDYEEPCGNCDNCQTGSTTVEDDADQPYALNSRVRHREWGEGLVLRYEGGTVTVLFDEQGYRTLDLGVVEDNGLLRPT